MRYWDSSGVVPLIVAEQGSPLVLKWLAADSEIVTWWGTILECTSAVVRRSREGMLSGEDVARTLDRLRRLAEGWDEIDPGEELRALANQLLQMHTLRTGDALQLAAALVACEDHPAGMEFVSFDERLREAAGKEGFVLVPASPPLP